MRYLRTTILAAAVAIRDNADGTITTFPSHSKTDQVTWHVGVSYTIPRITRR